MPERKESISPSSFYGQLPDYQLYVLASSTWQLSSSCCWFKSRELGGRGSPRCVTSVVVSFSLDLVPAIISYWAGSHLESCKTSCQIYTMELFCENRQRSYHVDYFRKKNSDVRLDSKCASDWRYCKCGMQVDCNFMAFVTTGWCTGKQSFKV